MFAHVVLGGTFDHLHKGHKALIEKAFAVGKKVTIGLASEKLIKNKFLSQTIESYSARLNTLKKYFSLKKLSDRVKILKINDIFGSTLTDKTIEAIVVSQATYANALLINQRRLEKNLPPLKIIVVEDVLAEDKQVISSERIREGEIDREGHSYQLSVFDKRQRPLILPKFLKRRLRRPLGKVFKVSEKEIEIGGKVLVDFIKKKKPSFVFSVGDIVSYSLIKNHYFPHLKIIDYRTKRKEAPSFIKKLLETNFLFKTVNKPGSINIQVVKTIKIAVEKILTKRSRETVFVEGEEDLLTLPLILFSPLGTLVFYGQWLTGVVVVEVTEEKKREVKNILQKFNQ